MIIFNSAAVILIISKKKHHQRFLSSWNIKTSNSLLLCFSFLSWDTCLFPKFLFPFKGSPPAICWLLPNPPPPFRPRLSSSRLFFGCPWKDGTWTNIEQIFREDRSVDRPCCCLCYKVSVQLIAQKALYLRCQVSLGSTPCWFMTQKFSCRLSLPWIQAAL